MKDDTKRAKAGPLLGPGVAIDVDRLIATRMLVQANSGGGKSWAIRRILEQTFGACQHIVIDVEGEFHSLRQKFDYVLAAPSGGDCRVDAASAPLLARRLLELNVSAIVDVYELGPRRAAFIASFLGALVDAPRELWHPMIIVVDEAQKYCPEVDRKDKRESSAAIEALMTLGRKRGMCPILATQRISELRKSAAAECNNKLIGRCGLDVDMARAARELGFSRRVDVASLRDLAPGEFYAFGPAISTQGVSLVRIGPVETTHPEIGQSAAPPTPPSPRIRAILAELGDLPAGAAREAETVDALRTQIRTLEQDLQGARATKGEVRIVERVVEKPTVPAGTIAKLDLLAQHARDLHEAVDHLMIDVTRIHEDLGALKATEATAKVDAKIAPTLEKGNAETPAKSSAPKTSTPRTPRPSRKIAAGEPSELSSAEGRLLEALAFLEVIGVPAPRLPAVALLAGYRPSGGAFHGVRGGLRADGLVSYPSPGAMSLTDRGRALAPRASLPPASGEHLRAVILERLGELERRLLGSLIEAYPRTLALAELAALNGYKGSGGAFCGARGRLRTLGLASYPRPGFVRAADLLFPTTNEAGGRARA